MKNTAPDRLEQYIVVIMAAALIVTMIALPSPAHAECTSGYWIFK